jgi:hypothetical protein
LNIDEDALLLAFNEADLSPAHPRCALCPQRQPAFPPHQIDCHLRRTGH